MELNEIDDWVKSLGSTLKDVRTEKGLTQSELAAKSGISQGAIAKIEAGSQSMNLAAFLKLSSSLEISAGDFLSAWEQSKNQDRIFSQFDSQLRDELKYLAIKDKSYQLKISRLLKLIREL